MDGWASSHLICVLLLYCKGASESTYIDTNVPLSDSGPTLFHVFLTLIEGLLPDPVHLLVCLRWGRDCDQQIGHQVLPSRFMEFRLRDKDLREKLDNAE